MQLKICRLREQMKKHIRTARKSSAETLLIFSIHGTSNAGGYPAQNKNNCSETTNRTLCNKITKQNVGRKTSHREKQKISTNNVKKMEIFHRKHINRNSIPLGMLNRWFTFSDFKSSYPLSDDATGRYGGSSPWLSITRRLRLVLSPMVVDPL